MCTCAPEARQGRQEEAAKILPADRPPALLRRCPDSLTGGGSGADHLPLRAPPGAAAAELKQSPETKIASQANGYGSAAVWTEHTNGIKADAKRAAASAFGLFLTPAALYSFILFIFFINTLATELLWF